MPTIQNPEQGIQEKPPTPPDATTPAPPASTDSTKPAKPAKAPADPVVWARRLKRVDYLLALLVLLLTFLLGSFAVTNSDFWLHLGTGRLIASGEYTFGEDPFCFTTEGITWVNHEWLYDWSLYGLHELLGEEGLVAAKALLIVALVVVLLQIRHRDDSLAVPLMCVTLAVIAASFQFTFRPILVSLLLFGVVLLLMLKNETTWDGAAPPPASMPRYLWFVPVLFILWANLDAWFVAGLLTLALYWLGLAIQKARTQLVPLAPRHAGVVFGLSLLACLLNPHHVQVFSLPVDLAYPLVRLSDTLGIPLPDGLVAAGRTMQQVRHYDPTSLPLYSPISEAFVNGPNSGRLVAGAYFLMLTLSVLSFAAYFVSNAPLPWSRLAPWLFFAVTSLMQTRFIAFFVIIAVPVTVLNWYGVRQRHAAASATLSVRSALLTRLAGGLLLTALILLAWPGWVHGKWEDWQAQRRVAWRLTPDPSWEKTADKLRQLHTAGIKRGLCFSVDTAQYCAWRCPEVKHFYDYRFALFPRVADRIARLRREFKEEAERFLKKKEEEAFKEKKPRSTDELPEWNKAVQQYQLQYVVFPGNMTERKTIERRWIDPMHWPLVYQDGRTFTFGYAESATDASLARFRVSPAEEAFGTIPKEKRTSPSAFPVKTANFGELYLYGRPAASLAVADFDVLTLQAQVQVYWIEQFIAASIVIQSHGSYPPPSLYFLTPYSSNWRAENLKRLQAQDKSGALLARWLALDPARWTNAALGMAPTIRVLMMRRARQALAENARDAGTFERLFIAADNLLTLENSWSQPMAILGQPPLRVTIRQLQRLAALKALVTLEPKNPNIHEKVAETYAQMNFLDVAQEHYALALKYMDRLTQPPGAKDWPQFVQNRKNYFKQKLFELDEGVGKFAGLKKLSEEFDSQVAGRDDPLSRYDVAFKLGFKRKALAFLEKVQISEYKLFDQRNLAFNQLILLLQMGRVNEVRTHLDVDVKKLFLEAPPADLRWHHVNALTASVMGDYAEVEKSLALLEAPLERFLPRATAMRDVAILSHLCQPNRIAAAVGVQAHATYLRHHDQYWLPYNRSADFRLARALMALEHGDTDLSAQHFTKVIELSQGLGRVFADRAIAQEYLLRLKPRP